MSNNEVQISNFVSLEDSRINENAYVSPRDLFESGEQFAIVGIGEPQEKVFRAGDKPAVVVEVEIVLIATGETRMMGMSYNGYRQNIKNHFKNGGKPIAPVVIVKLESQVKGNNDAWGFAAPTEALKRMNAEQGGEAPF